MSRKEGLADSRDAKPTLDERGGARREPSTPPANLARYRFGLEIARGGMGRVVEATDTLLGRIVAIKEALGTDPEALRRFARETRITARLEHPSIVPVHDAGRSPDGSPYYVMRKVSGRPLEDLVRAADSLEQRLALLPHVVAAAQAVAHAHQRGVLHRDLKPSNILVGDLGEAVVIDWGLAKVIDEPDEVVSDAPPGAGESLRTRFGTVFGTPGFMSPEQLRGEPVDARSDVYALGATLYHLLSREPPHASRSADDMMEAALAGPPQPIADRVPGVPAELSTIVDKALAYDDRVRYGDAGALVEDLQRFLTGQLVASHRYSRRERLLRFMRKNRVAVTVSAAAAIALAIGAWIAIGSVIRERDRADAALHDALDRNETLTIYQAQGLAGTNPTAAIALLKTLPPARREVRMIATAARTAGVAWGLPASRRTASVVLSADGLRALTAGNDGAIREYDLRTHEVRMIANVGEFVRAWWLDGERAIVVAQDNWLKILDAKTGDLRRDVELATRVRYLRVSGRSAWWSDVHGHAWRLDVDAAAPVPIAIDDDLFEVAPSPDGAWIAWAGRHHVWLSEVAHIASPPRTFGGDTTAIAWSNDSKSLAFATHDHLGNVRIDGEPTVELDDPGPQFVYNIATRDARVYAGTLDGITMTTAAHTTRLRKRTEPVVTGLMFGYRDSMIAPMSTDRVYVLNDDLDVDLVLSAPVAALGIVAVSPRSPYVVASTEGVLLVWNLDDVLPKRVPIEQPVQMTVVGSNQLITQSVMGDATWHDLDTGESRKLGRVLGPATVRSPIEGRVAVLTTLDGRTFVRWWDDRPPLEVGTNVIGAVFMDRDHLLYATEHDVHIVDLATRQPRHVATLPCAILLLAHHSTWLATRCTDGTLWRRDLATGVEQTKRMAMTEAESIVLAADGSVYFLDDKRIRVWETSDAISDPVELHRSAHDLDAVDDDHLLVLTDDSAGYIIDIHTRAITSRVPTGSRLSSLDVTPEMTTAVDQTGAVIGLDLVTGIRWMIGRGPDAIAFPQLTSDGKRVVALSPHQILVWSLDHPIAPADVARWLDELTNAVAPAGPTALTWQ